MDEIIVNNLPENTSPTVADKLMLIRTADGELTLVSVEDLSNVIGGAVTSVNGQTGAVVIPIPAKTSDLTNDSGFVNAAGAAAAAPVQSVNGQTGAVVLDADDVGALPDDTTAADLGAYVKPSGGIPKTDLASAVQTSLGKADTALQSVPNTYRTAAAQDTIDAGKIAAPSSPATGAFLVWNGSAWVAQTLSTWQGGSY